MKKRIINEIRIFLLFLVANAYLVAMLVLGVTYSKSFTSAIIVSIVFGVFLSLGIYILVISFELIVFCDDKIISRKIFKKTRIFYKDIVSIHKVKEGFNSVENANSAWKILSVDDKVVNLISTKRRDKFIEQLIEHIDNKK